MSLTRATISQLLKNKSLRWFCLNLMDLVLYQQLKPCSQAYQVYLIAWAFNCCSVFWLTWQLTPRKQLSKILQLPNYLYSTHHLGSSSFHTNKAHEIASLVTIFQPKLITLRLLFCAYVCRNYFSSSPPSYSNPQITSLNRQINKPQ